MYQKIRGYLDRVLLGSKAEWELSYTSAKTHLLRDAEKFSHLEEIYNNPSHYAGWFLRTVEGNLLLNGSVPAEQNHSSVAAHLGGGASWSVVEQVSKLLSRQTHLSSKRRQQESQAYVRHLKYKSKHIDQAAADDEDAKKQLSHWAYTRLFVVEYEASCRLQYQADEHGTMVWPNGKPSSCDEHVIIPSGDRCRCQRRMAYNHQCRHELCFDGKFIVAKYSRRWLNRRTYDLNFPSDSSQMPHSLGQQAVANALFTDGDEVEDLKLQPSVGNGDDDDDSFGDATHDFCDESEDVPISLLGGDASKEQKLTYQFVAEKATNLVRLAQTDQVRLGSLCNLLEQLSSRIRNGHSIEVLSFDAALPLPQESLGATPVLGTLKSAPNTYNQRRRISRHENRRNYANKRKNPLLSLVGQSNDLAHVPPPRPNTKTCSICKCPGHQRGSCPKIHQFKTKPLDMGKDLKSRRELSSALSKVSRYRTGFLSEEDKRVVSDSLPTRMLGIVIHQRFYLNRETTKMCLECTCLDHIGDRHSTFQNYLFEVEIVASYVHRSKTNVVVCELEDACIEGYESFGFPTQETIQRRSGLRTQQTIQHLSQTSQMGYGRLPLSQPTGYQNGYGMLPLSQATDHQKGYGMIPLSQQIAHMLSQMVQRGYGILANGMAASL